MSPVLLNPFGFGVPYPTEVLADSPLAYWRLNEDYPSATALATYSAVSPINAFDGLTGSNPPWYNNGASGTGILEIEFPAALALTGYTIYSMNDASGPARAPGAWTFQGSNDNSTWTTLDTRSGQTGWVYTTPRSFTFSNSTAYKFYRINVTATAGGDAYIAIEEMTFTPSPANVPIPSTYADSSGNARHLTRGGGSPAPGGSLLGSGLGSSAVFSSARSDYLAIANASWMDVGTMTIEARIKTVASGGNFVLSRWGTAGNHQFLFNVGGTTPGVTVNISGTERTLTGSTLTAGTVHTIAMTYNGTTLCLYIDGALNNSASYSGAIPALTGSPIEVARAALAAYDNSQAAEISFFGSALSAARIAARHAAAIA